MIEKRFLLPWQKKYIIVCPECGGRIWTTPLWYWQKQPDKLGELQLRFCHSIGSEFLEKIPVLTENDWKSKQKWDTLCEDLEDGLGRPKPYDEVKELFTVDDGLLKIFAKHGIFGLVRFFTETELKAIFLLLSLEPDQCPMQVWFQMTMGISRSYVSTILKKLAEWRLIKPWKAPVKGRARGRQLVYSLVDEAHKILDQDLQSHDFFREALAQTARPIAEKFPKFAWRKDLVKLGE